MAEHKCSGLGPILSNVPLEIRREIYRQFFLICRRQPLQDVQSQGAYPDPVLQGHTDHDWIYVDPRDELINDWYHAECSTSEGKVSNLLRVNHTVGLEAWDVLYGRFVLYMSDKHSAYSAFHFTNGLSESAVAQIAHLAFLIPFPDQPSEPFYDNSISGLWNSKEGNEMLVQSLPNLRTVCFEIKFPDEFHEDLCNSNEWSVSTAYDIVVQQAFAVVRPFTRIPGLKILWVGRDHDAHLAKLCTERSSIGYDWPWSEVDERLYQMSIDCIISPPDSRGVPPAVEAMRCRCGVNPFRQPNANYPTNKHVIRDEYLLFGASQASLTIPGGPHEYPS